jgi:hypothetical protein
MQFRLTSKTQHDPAKLRFRCLCGNEYSPAQATTCPTCGRAIPREISFDNGPWQTYAQYKAQALRQILAPDALNEAPPHIRDAIRQKTLDQIRELEGGTWKAKAQQKIAALRSAPTPPATTTPENQAAVKAQMEATIQRLQEELDVGQ